MDEVYKRAPMDGFACLAQLHGFDVSPFKQWFDKDAALFARHGLSWNYG